MHANFEAAYASSKQLTIFWCPIVGQDPASAMDRISSSEDIINAVKQLWGSSAWGGSEETRIKAVVDQFMPAPADTGESDTKSLGKQQNERKVALFENVIKKSSDEERAILSSSIMTRNEPRLSFGLWKEKDSRLLSGTVKLPTIKLSRLSKQWFPEINVCRTYANDEKPSLNDLQKLLEVYSKKMGQDSIYIKLDESPWIYGKKSKQFYPKPGVRWHLETISLDNWMFQFQAILDRLNRSANDNYWREPERKIWDAVIEPELEKLPDKEGLGATIEIGAGEYALMVSIGGPSSFLFKPFFEGVLSEYVVIRFEKTSSGEYASPEYREGLSSSDAILLEIDKDLSNHRNVRYAFYARATSDGKRNGEQRCLCGKSYPRHEGREDLGIVSMRETLADVVTWIKEQYQRRTNHRGAGWDWGLLSSPHFYFSSDPNLLKKNGVNKVERSKAEEEAIQRAIDYWDELMSSFFEGSNLSLE